MKIKITNTTSGRSISIVGKILPTDKTATFPVSKCTDAVINYMFTTLDGLIKVQAYHINPKALIEVTKKEQIKELVSESGDFYLELMGMSEPEAKVEVEAKQEAKVEVEAKQEAKQEAKVEVEAKQEAKVEVEVEAETKVEEVAEKKTKTRRRK
ncbi:hypothetical protein JHD46_08230 [Sulfurimonas sp. SAG-AH-194-C20]|nr:hypothetical protein [Sulfurimonas sp. SAG-AH-194-C20]MDF1879622.1 hypothetical protein [Sulfurimonas sp. SAG-AH-194-C20]